MSIEYYGIVTVIIVIFLRLYYNNWWRNEHIGDLTITWKLVLQ